MSKYLIDLTSRRYRTLCCAVLRRCVYEKPKYIFLYLRPILKTNSVKCYKTSYWLLEISTIKLCLAYQISIPLNCDGIIIGNIRKIKVHIFSCKDSFVKTRLKVVVSLNKNIVKPGP